jgi:hypothetical protein
VPHARSSRRLRPRRRRSVCRVTWIDDRTGKGIRVDARNDRHIEVGHTGGRPIGSPACEAASSPNLATAPRHSRRDPVESPGVSPTTTKATRSRSRASIRSSASRAALTISR